MEQDNKKETIIISPAKLSQIIEEAAEKGGNKALREVGIKSPEEAKRFRQIMYFSGQWMDSAAEAKKTIWRTFTRTAFWFVMGLIAWGLIALVNFVNNGKITHISIF